jgi:hypothetical protein
MVKHFHDPDKDCLILTKKYPKLKYLHLSRSKIKELRSVVNKFYPSKNIREQPYGLWYSRRHKNKFVRLLENKGIRIRKDSTIYGSKYAYMFNIPRKRILVITSIEQELALKPDILKEYAGVEYQLKSKEYGRYYHHVNNYGCIWDMTAIEDWTLASKFSDYTWK